MLHMADPTTSAPVAPIEIVLLRIVLAFRVLGFVWMLLLVIGAFLTDDLADRGVVVVMTTLAGGLDPLHGLVGTLTGPHQVAVVRSHPTACSSIGGCAATSGSRTPSIHNFEQDEPMRTVRTEGALVSGLVQDSTASTTTTEMLSTPPATFAL
jgi:hypothetical protein